MLYAKGDQMTHNENNKFFNKSSLSKQTRNLTFVLCMGMLAGVLIWAKLRLVTDIPRSAYAEPRELDASGSDENSYQNDDISISDEDEQSIESESAEHAVDQKNKTPVQDFTDRP